MSPGLNLLTTHGKVLVALARDPYLRVRDIAVNVGVTERAAQQIVGALVEAGYVERIKEGRRNRYLVRGDRPLPDDGHRPHDVSELLGVLVPDPRVTPSPHECEAVVLACSDHRFQEPLRALLAAEGLLGRAETVLLPGGASAIGGADGTRILAGLEYLCRMRGPNRLLLMAHQGCAVPGAYVAHRRDPFTVRRFVSDRRRRTVDRVFRRLDIVPEIWFMDERGASRIRVPRPDRDRHVARAAGPEAS
jgi:hypothetical protein